MKGGGRRIFGPPVDARKDRDEDLFLFHEMRRRERERTVNLLQPVSDELESNSGNYPLYRIPAGKKGSGNEFFPFESEKNDYDWLKTPPATPLFPSLEMEATGPNFVVQKEFPILQAIKYSRFSGYNSEASKAKVETPASHATANTPNPKSSASSRSVTPSTKPSVSAKLSATRGISISTEKATHSTVDTYKKSSFPTLTGVKSTNPKQISSNVAETNASKSRANVSDPKQRSRGVSPLVSSRIPATIPGYSDETPPNLRTSAPSDRSTSATRGRPANPVTIPGFSNETAPNLKTDRSTSATRGRPANPVTFPGFSSETPPNLKTDRSTSATRGRPANPVTIPVFSNETPPNLKTTAVSDRSSSASRGRPGNPTTDTKQEAGKVRRQSCSPSVARGRRPELRKESEQNPVIMGNGRIQAGNGSFVLGSRMVERVMNARKTVAVEQKDPKSKFRASGGSGSSGFGSVMSKNSLDMALKHMEIKKYPTNYHHFNTRSERSSTTASSNSSLNLSPRRARQEDFEDVENVNGPENRKIPVKGSNKS